MEGDRACVRGLWRIGGCLPCRSPLKGVLTPQKIRWWWECGIRLFEKLNFGLGGINIVIQVNDLA